jgi:hypothetical protein
MGLFVPRPRSGQIYRRQRFIKERVRENGLTGRAKMISPVFLFF